MTFEELQAALEQAHATGKVGTPVAARVHLQLPEPTTDPAMVLTSVLRMLSPCFTDTPNTLRVRSASTQWNILLQTPAGRSLFVTIGCAAVTRSTVHLLVVGNHGIIRLEGSDDLRFSPTDSASTRMTAAIAEGVRSGRVVSLSPDGSPSR